jgi:3-hydroxyethyl bacteriochlorophyllide a dehydrogenase
MALAATAHHAVAGGATPDLIVGHGIVGQLIARIAMARGGQAPTVWETNPDRRDGDGYAVIDPEADRHRDYRTVVDASGASDIVDTLVGRLAKQGEVVLAGFYQHISFRFPPAFMREARLRISAEFTAEDLTATRALVDSGALSLAGLISHVRPADEAVDAYPAAFEDRNCRKMVLDWRGL